MYLLRKYLKNNENINKYIFPETVSSLQGTKSNNPRIWGTQLFGLSIEELMERQRVLTIKELENKNNKKTNKANHNKKTSSSSSSSLEDNTSFKSKNSYNNNKKNKKNTKNKNNKDILDNKDNNNNKSNDTRNIDNLIPTPVTEKKTEILKNDLIDETHIITMESIFQSEYSLENIPIEIQQFVNYLKQDKILMKEGIFRLGGCYNLKNEIKEKIDKSGKIDFTNYSDVHAIATLFKQFLRELSGKIIPKNLFTLFESAKDSDDKIREALSQLPKQRYDTLLYILEFIFYIDKYKKYNKMDIENLCIVFAPNIIECLETADMHTTLIAPLHIINSIIRYFEKIRMKREEDELKLSYFDIKPVYDEENNSEENSVKDIVFRGYDYDIVSLEDSDSSSSLSDTSDEISDIDNMSIHHDTNININTNTDDNDDDDDDNVNNNNSYDDKNNENNDDPNYKVLINYNNYNYNNYNEDDDNSNENHYFTFDIRDINNSEIKVEFFLGNDDEKTLSCNNDEKTLLCNNDEKTLPDNNDEKASSDNNKDNHSDRVIKEVVESLDFLDSSTIDIKYCNDIISLEDSTIGTSINLNTSISRNMSTDINSNSNLISNFNDAPSVLLKPNKYKKYLDDKNALKENYENKIFELVDQNNRLDSSVTILNDNKFIEIDCSNITQYPIPNNYLSKEETLINLDDKRDDPENYNISNSYNPNLNENKNNNYYITLLSNFDNLKKKYNNSCNIISSIRNKNTNDDKRNSHVEKNNSNKYNKNKPIIDSIRYISGELISSNSVNNIYSSNSIEMNNKNKYNLLETMKVKDIMNLNSEEKAKITRNFSVNESLLINKEKLCQKQKGKLPYLSQQIIDIEPYTLNSRQDKNQEKDFILNSNSNNFEIYEKKEEKEEKIREIMNSINFYNKNKSKKKHYSSDSNSNSNSSNNNNNNNNNNNHSHNNNNINDNNNDNNNDNDNKCESVILDDEILIHKNDQGNSGVDGNKEEIIKGLKDFNTQLKNVTKTQSMNSTQHQQQKLFIERLRDLEHYIKFLDRYIKELKEFSKREDEDTEVIKEMERFTRKKFKLLRLYIKDELNKYKIYKDGNINVYYPFIDLQSWMKKNESEDALSKHKDLKLENVCFYYGIKDLSPGQRIIRNIDKRRQLERRSIYVFAMKPGEIMKTYKEIKRELSTLKSFYANFKSDSTIEKEKLEEYRMIDKIILKELFWYINRLKMSIEKVKDKDKEKRNSLKKIDNPFERCMFNACKNEKKKLQEELITYQENFYKKNGRPIKTKNDLKPIEAQYKRYKELKTYLKSFSVISE